MASKLAELRPDSDRVTLTGGLGYQKHKFVDFSAWRIGEIPNLILETSCYRALGNGRASRDEGVE